MSIQQRFLQSFATVILLVVAFSLPTTAVAQIANVTFTGLDENSDPIPGSIGVSELEFLFGGQDTEFQIDQLLGGTVFFLANDDFGQELGYSFGTPSATVREVAIGEVLTASGFGGSASFNIANDYSPGDDFFLGFSDGADVGYFNVAWDSGLNSSLRITGGLVASGGGSVTVNAIPEPSALGLLLVAGLLANSRRKRSL